MSSALEAGESVKISGFGTFSVRQKGRRVGRNPKTGEEVPILPRRVLVFRPSHVLKAHVNGTAPEPGRRRMSDDAGRRWTDDDGGIDGSIRAARPKKAPNAFRTISEVADELHIPQHVLRFWETKFPQVKPLKRGGGRRYYRPDDIALLRRISDLLYIQGYTIKGVQRLLREGGGRLSDDIPPPSPEEQAETAEEHGASSPSEEPELPMPELATAPVMPAPRATPRPESEAEAERLRAALTEVLKQLAGAEGARAALTGKAGNALERGRRLFPAGAAGELRGAGRNARSASAE